MSKNGSSRTKNVPFTIRKWCTAPGSPLLGTRKSDSLTGRIVRLPKIDHPRIVIILTRCLPTFSGGDCVCVRQSLLWQWGQKYSEVLKVILIGLNWSDLIKKSVSKRKEDLLDSFNENFKHATAHCWYTWKCRKMETKWSNENSNPQQCETWTVNPM